MLIGLEWGGVLAAGRKAEEPLPCFHSMGNSIVKSYLHPARREGETWQKNGKMRKAGT